MSRTLTKVSKKTNTRRGFRRKPDQERIRRRQQQFLEERQAAAEQQLIEEKQAEVAQLEEEFSVDMFTIRSANETMRQAALMKEPTKLYDEFWYEDEMGCLFADSNVGKSVLAVQIANEIAKKGMKVLYFDFELSDKQFECRYKDEQDGTPYQFPDKLYRVCMNNLRVCCKAEELADRIIENIESCVNETQAKVVIIDNLTWIINTGRSVQMAGELMKRLDALKREHGLSMLILAHTKKRNMSKAITQNDLGGSKMIFNFLDSAFAIGMSAKDPRTRYVKQLKTRYSEMKYGSDNVMLCCIKKEDNFLQFIIDGYDEESNHLKKLKGKDMQEIIAQIKALRAQGKSYREIARELGISSSSAERWDKQ